MVTFADFVLETWFMGGGWRSFVGFVFALELWFMMNVVENDTKTTNGNANELRIGV